MGGHQGVGWGIEDEHLMHFSADWLQKQTQPTFLTLFTISNHHPWIAPKDYAAPEFGFSGVKERFYQTMHYTDHCLGLFVDLLRQKNLHEKTILFVLGDHGQPMGEHFDNFYNTRFLYEENIHVPLLILAEERGVVPKIIDTPSSQVDLLPTLVDLLQVPSAIPQIGSSLLRASTPSRTIFFQNPYSEGFSGCRKGKWKWIRNHDSGEGELYQLDRDPQELQNLSEEHPELAKSLNRETVDFFEGIEAFYGGKKWPSTELDLSNQLIEDEKLLKQATPFLRVVCLDNCHLLTDEGIAAFFAKCPSLEAVSLKGLSSLTDRCLYTQLPAGLSSLDLSDSPLISDTGLLHLAQNCLCLKYLSLNGQNLTERGLLYLLPTLTDFRLYNASHITPETRVAFLSKNRHLINSIFSDLTY
jgi:hypothetical protein